MRNTHAARTMIRVRPRTRSSPEVGRLPPESSAMDTPASTANKGAARP
jgi:hypothetical protein